MNINKVRRSFLLSVVVVASVALMGCTETPQLKPPAAASSPTPGASAIPVSPAASPSGTTSGSKMDSLLGRWAGPGGSSLNVSRKGDTYSIELTNSAGVKSFEGTAKGETIEFIRNGKTEVLKAANGAETGIKEFEKETNCIVITKGTDSFCKK